MEANGKFLWKGFAVGLLSFESVFRHDAGGGRPWLMLPEQKGETV